jgi:transcriptional regulator of nitric oxide reductase
VNKRLLLLRLVGLPKAMLEAVRQKGRSAKKTAQATEEEEAPVVLQPAAIPVDSAPAAAVTLGLMNQSLAKGAKQASGNISIGAGNPNCTRFVAKDKLWSPSALESE